MTSSHFLFECLDADFASRFSAEEFQRILTLRNNPRFMKGLTEYGVLIPEYFANNFILNRVVTEVWRFEMLVFTLYLYDTRNKDDFRSGLTVANLQKLCAEHTIASSGRVLAILGIMRLGGYLKRIKSENDRRVVQLEPSEGFIQIVEGWNRRLLKIIDAVLPEENLAQWHTDHPRFGWAMRRLGAEGMLKGWRLLKPFPEVEHFVRSDGGWMLLLTCVSQSLAKSDFKSIERVSLDLRSFGARFGVSRSHLRRLLESAYAEGLLDEPPRNGTTILLSAKLVASFLTCMASELGYYLEHAREARVEVTAMARA
jgi:hypothetical protein